MQTDLEANSAVNQTQFKVWLIFGRWYFNAGWHFLRPCSSRLPLVSNKQTFPADCAGNRSCVIWHIFTLITTFRRLWKVENLWCRSDPKCRLARHRRPPPHRLAQNGQRDTVLGTQKGGKLQNNRKMGTVCQKRTRVMIRSPVIWGSTNKPTQYYLCPFLLWVTFRTFGLLLLMVGTESGCRKFWSLRQVKPASAAFCNKWVKGLFSFKG